MKANKGLCWVYDVIPRYVFSIYRSHIVATENLTLSISICWTSKGIQGSIFEFL